MQSDDLRALLRSRPFEPLLLAFSDGRSVVVRHPVQAVVTRRKVFVGVVQIRSSGRLNTPADADAIPKDWILVDLVHVVSAEPLNNQRGRRKRR